MFAEPGRTYRGPVFPDPTATIGVEKLAAQFRSAPEHVRGAVVQQIEDGSRPSPTRRNRYSSRDTSLKLFSPRLNRGVPFHQDAPSQKVWNVWLERTTFRRGMKKYAFRRPVGGREHREILAGSPSFGGNGPASHGAEPGRVKRGEGS